jgi:hypothetical protein
MLTTAAMIMTVAMMTKTAAQTPVAACTSRRREQREPQQALGMHCDLLAWLHVANAVAHGLGADVIGGMCLIDVQLDCVRCTC